MKRVRLLGIAGIAAHWGPMVMSVGALRRKTLPTLAGIAPGSGVALT